MLVRLDIAIWIPRQHLPSVALASPQSSSIGLRDTESEPTVATRCIALETTTWTTNHDLLAIG